MKPFLMFDFRGQLIIIVLLLFTVVLQGQTVDVSIPGFNFDPDTIYINTGMTVQWTNNHTINHSTTSIDGFWDSGTMIPGAVYSHTFTDPGVFDYYCTFHPSMTGTVIVLRELYSIPQLYAGLPLVDGQQVRVYGAYTGPEDSKMVVSYEDYERDELMPPFSVIFVQGFEPAPEYFDGGIVIATGIVNTAPADFVVYDEDTVVITLAIVDYEYILPGQNIFEGFEGDGTKSYDESSLGDTRGCDSCKFAILISGGGSGTNNKPTYWKNIEDLYKYKTDTTANGGNYCPENVKILYFKGDSENPGLIGNDKVDSCTKAKIRAAHQAIAQKIAACTRAGKDAEVQKMVTNHGYSDGDITLLGNTEWLPGDTLKKMQQELIDSCCKKMIDEMIQCYGGKIINDLKGLDDKNKTEMHMNSAAGATTPGWSPVTGGHVYLQEKIARLRAGDDYETAVRKAKDKYQTMLDSSLARRGRRLDSLRTVRDTMSAENPAKPLLDSTITKAAADSTKMSGSRAQGSPSWVRYQFKKYCEWKKIVCQPGGQFDFKFKGSGGCGNVSIYEEQPDGTKKRVKRLNWNLPGSLGYTTGNDERVVKVNSSSTGVFWVHNNNGQFTLTVDSKPNQDAVAASISNAHEFAGESAGGDDASSDEFGDINAFSYMAPLYDQDGFELSMLPRQMGACGGVQQSFQTSFFAETPNPWWENMELYLNINEVLQPGELMITCPSAQIPTQAIMITEPGEYFVPLGAINAPSEGLLILEIPDFAESLCFTFDSWALRTLVPTWEDTFLCGDANADGSVNVSDAVYLINFVFTSGEPPIPYEAGEVNCDGTVNVSDAVWIINYVFVGGGAPCECK